MQTIAGFDRIGEENAFAVLARAGQLAAQGRDVINLGIGQPDFPTPPNIVEAAVKALRDGQHGYTPATGSAAAARGGGGGPSPALRGGGEPRPGADRARRQGHDVHRDPDVRRAGGGHPVSGPGLSDLPLDDRVHRRAASADPDPRGQRLRLLGRGDAGADHAGDAADHRQLAGQSDGRGDARRPRWTGWWRVWPSIRRSRSCRTRSTTRCSTTARST